MLFSGITYSQLTQPVRLTNGNNDRNPSFHSGSEFFIDFGSFEFEFMAFERHSGNQSNICVSKITAAGSQDSAIYLTNDTYNNLNPAIAYNIKWYENQNIIKNSLVVWQSNKFGRQSIFGSSYSASSGWSLPFIIDSSNANNTNPKLSMLDTSNYIITYVSDDDIKYKKFNVDLRETIVERNLTLQEPGVCTNPKVTLFNSSSNNTNVAISYEREIYTMQRAIYVRTGYADSISYVGNPGDTIAYTGINRNLGFGRLTFNDVSIFESDRSGKINVYATSFLPQLTHTQFPVISNNFYDILNYTGTDFPITDASGLTNKIFSYNKRSGNGIKIVVLPFYAGADTNGYNVSYDTLFDPVIALNVAVRVPDQPCQRFWFVYNKDSIDSDYPTTIYGIAFTNCFTDIMQTSNSQPESFYLNQNYPNPFNPETNLEFGISDLEFVSLKIYNVLGNEVATLVNETKPAGRYSVEWNAGEFPSGIYFYKLTAGSFSEVRKMTLLK